jgi:hypothetical protein
MQGKREEEKNKNGLERNEYKRKWKNVIKKKVI